MGIPVMPFESYDQALNLIEEIIKSKCKSFWIAINPIKIYHAWHEPELYKILKQADFGICDGIGVSITSKILHGKKIVRNCSQYSQDECCADCNRKEYDKEPGKY